MQMVGQRASCPGGAGKGVGKGLEELEHNTGHASCLFAYMSRDSQTQDGPKGLNQISASKLEAGTLSLTQRQLLQLAFLIGQPSG